MVQKIITLCDVHSKMDPPENVDAESYQVSFDGSENYVLDLCPECFESYAKPFYDLVMVCGRQREKQRPRHKTKVKAKDAERKSGFGVAATYRCPQCDYGTEYLQSFRFHCVRKHEMSDGEYAEAAGTAGGAHICPECGIGFKSVSGVALHKTRKHPLPVTLAS